MRINKNIHSVTKENDMKYRGFLSYRYMRIIGWVAMVLAQASVILGMMANQWSPEKHNIDALWNASDILSFLGQLALPLFLIANFALIFSARENIKKLMLTHLGIAIAIYVGFIIFYYRYVLDVGRMMFDKSTIDAVITNLLENYLTFNVFIDLFMCSSLYFFMVYRPKKIFVDKKLIIFRLFSLLPILYEVASIVLKGLSVGQDAIGDGLFTIPVEVMPLLTTKPVATFVAFVVILLIMKYRQIVYVKRGGTLEQYEDFVQTNTNSFHFSVLVAVIFAIAALLDFIACCILYGAFTYLEPEFILLDPIKAFKAFNNWCKGWGVGRGMALILVSPIMLLFSYTKTHDKKTKILDIFIPLIGICLCILAYLEGFRDLLIYK